MIPMHRHYIVCFLYSLDFFFPMSQAIGSNDDFAVGTRVSPYPQQRFTIFAAHVWKYADPVDRPLAPHATDATIATMTTSYPDVVMVVASAAMMVVVMVAVFLGSLTVAFRLSVNEVMVRGLTSDRSSVPGPTVTLGRVFKA